MARKPAREVAPLCLPGTSVGIHYNLRIQRASLLSVIKEWEHFQLWGAFERFWDALQSLLLLLPLLLPYSQGGDRNWDGAKWERFTNVCAIFTVVRNRVLFFFVFVLFPKSIHSLGSLELCSERQQILNRESNAKEIIVTRIILTCTSQRVVLACVPIICCVSRFLAPKTLKERRRNM